MENQQNEQQENVNQQEQNPNDMSTEERFSMNEHFLAEAMKGYQLSGQAINRLESYVFVLVDLILKKDIATFEEIKNLQTKLGEHDDLLKFWGVGATENTNTASSD